MATMMPHFRLRRIHPSANMMGDCCVRRRWEWCTKAATADHLGHDMLPDIAGLLWVVSYIGISRVI